MSKSQTRSKNSDRAHPRAQELQALLHSHTGHLVRRFQQISVSMFLDVGRPYDLTPTQYAAMAAIAASPGCDQASIAGLAALDRSTAGNVIAKLLRKGLVSRQPSRDDRRFMILALTPAGFRLLQKLQPILAATNERMLQPLSAAERKQFVALLARLVDVNNAASRAPLRSPRKA
ncbi:MAG: MarR family winged helix-turn-helix transcriptional regulator [Alphaproteobacteria bacterium]